MKIHRRNRLLAIGTSLWLLCAVACTASPPENTEESSERLPTVTESATVESEPMRESETESSVVTNQTTLPNPESNFETEIDPETAVDSLPDTESAPGADTGGITLPELEVPTETEVLTSPAETGAVDPVFSLPGGLLTDSSELALSLPDAAPEDAYILYTTDGSEPSAGGTRYRTAIAVPGDGDGTVVRAAVCDKDGEQLGHTVTMTYLRAGASSLRVVSLVTAPDNLYGDKGIFTDRTETGKAGERPVSVEIYEPNGKVLIRQDAAIRLSGAGSRSFDPANLRIIARKPASFGADADKYNGRGKFHAALFTEADDKAYDSFLLRCGGNDSLHQANANFLRMNMLRDAITNNILLQAEPLLGGSVFAQRTIPAAVYINGQYYGMLNMKEDFDENRIESMYGLPEEGIALLKGKKDGKNMYYNIESGTDADLTDWQALCTYCAEHALAPDYAEAYATVAQQIDLENFSRYYAVMLYLCNTDWPQNNTMVWRYTPTAGDRTDGKAYADGKWRAVIRDMDLCFGLHDKASQTSSTTYSMADTDTFYRITVFYRDGGYAYDPSLGLYDDTMGFQGLFDFLIRSEDFRTRFRTACEALSSEAFAALCRDEIDRYYALATPELPAHIRLWQGCGEIHADYTLRHFRDAKDDMLMFVQERPAYFQRYWEQAMTYYE